MAPVATNERPPAQEVGINPFYSPAITDDGDSNYKWAQYKPTFPKVSWPPLGPIDVEDRALHADPEKRDLLSAASKVITLTPAIGTEIYGLDLRQLTDAQKDQLALLAAERGVVFVYNDASRRPDTSAFSKLELWHSDVSYENQPPSTTSLKIYAGPETGGDTLWSSGYALYSSLSPGLQQYLEGLTAV
ncbi:hypothetical protein EWM64_g8081, partial [Hericium alpestre]